MHTSETLFIPAISLFLLLGIYLSAGRKFWQHGFGWIGLFFFLLAINFVDGLLLLNNFFVNHPRYAFWEDPLALLYGPFIYFFSIQLTGMGWKWAALSHLMPCIMIELLMVIFHASHSNAEVISILHSVRNLNQSPAMMLGSITLFAHVTTYILFARRALSQYRHDLQQRYSSMDLGWALQLVNMVLILFIVSFFGSIAQYAGLKDLFSVFLQSLAVITTLLTARLLLKVMSRPLFQTLSKPIGLTRLSDREAQKVKEKVSQAFTEGKQFINPELTLKDLADEIRVSDRIVSYVINKSFGKNFYEFVNDYRIDEACRILDENTDPKLTVAEVLYRVGFNSKSSFNTQFKKKTGLTPSQYKSKNKR